MTVPSIVSVLLSVAWAIPSVALISIRHLDHPIRNFAGSIRRFERQNK
ncbi:hypothetical protein [Lysinibacillus xylanilyticus]